MSNFAAFPSPRSLDWDLKKWNVQVIAGKPPRCPAIGEGSNPGNTISVIQHTDDFVTIYFRDDGSCGSSGRVTCTVRVEFQEPTKPVITQHPTALEVQHGEPAAFSIKASGGNLNYAWRKNGALIPGANSQTLEIPAAALSNAGVYDVVVSNPLGSATSAAAGLTVIPRPVRLNIRQLSAVWLEVSWDSRVGEKYILMFSDDLKTWSSTGNLLTGTGERIATRMPMLQSREYYRLQLVP